MNDKSEILRIHDQWISLEKSGREKNVLGLCSQDVVWLVPGLGMLQGVEEIHSFLIGQAETVIASIDTFNVTVEVSSELAIKRAKFCTTFMDNGSELRISGAHIWTLRKSRETRQWQVTSVAWAIEDKNT
ncbi:MAG: hypothetical protein AB7G08_32430 [Hyphomicrobiaceae bacterium]